MCNDQVLPIKILWYYAKPISVRKTRQQAARGREDEIATTAGLHERAGGGGHGCEVVARQGGGVRGEGRGARAASSEDVGRGGVGRGRGGVEQGTRVANTVPGTRVTRQRTRAKAKVGNAVETTQTVEEEIEMFEDDDDEPDIGKTLHAKDGKLGFVTNRGFVAATNFLVDIQSQVFSEKYSIKGIITTCSICFPL